MNPDGPALLVLPMPRRPFLWPALSFLVLSIQGFLGFTHYRYGTVLDQMLGVALLLGNLILGCSLVGIALATHWKELRLDGGVLILSPWWTGKLANAFLQLYDRSMAARLQGRSLEVSMASTSFEWVGRTLVLHAQPEMSVRLGRMAQAETIARWLKANGLGELAGR